jgi:hypothetical protein
MMYHAATGHVCFKSIGPLVIGAVAFEPRNTGVESIVERTAPNRLGSDN